MNDKQVLIELLQKRAVQKGEKKKLASGIESDVYVNCKGITLHGPSLWQTSGILCRLLRELEPGLTHVAGVSVGGDPIVAGIVAFAASQMNWPLNALLVRKAAKAHGASSGRAVDGETAHPTQKIWLVEDVISSGGSAEVAAGHMVNEGYKLAGILSLVDREMNGVEKLHQSFGVPVRSILKISELL